MDKEEQFKIKIKEEMKKGENRNINKCFEDLPAALKLKYIYLYNFNEYNSAETFINNIDDNSIIYEILKFACKQVDSKYMILNIFRLVPYEYKEDFFKTIKEREERNNEEVIEPYNVDEFIREFKLEDRERIIKEIIFKDFYYIDNQSERKRFDYFTNYAKILELFADEKTSLENSRLFKMLQFICEKNYQETNQGLFNSGNIINLFYKNGYDIKKVIKYLIDSNYIDKTGVTSISEKLPPEIRRDIVIYIIECYRNNNNKLGDYKFYDILSTLNTDEVIELFNKYALKEKMFDYIYRLNCMTDSNSEYTKLFYANTIFSLLSKEELDEKFSEIHNALISTDKLSSYSDKYNKIIEVYSEKYNVDYDGLTKFIKKFGFSVLKYIDNINIRKYINLPSDNLDKLLSIFDDKNLYFDKNIKNDIVNSLLQRQFMLKEKEIYNIFNTFEEYVSNKNIEGVKKLLDTIKQSINIEEYLVKNNINYDQLINQIMKGKLGVLHQITNRYIAFKREEYIRTRIKDIDNILMLDKVISRESYKKEYLRVYGVYIPDKLKNFDRNIFTNNQLKLLDDKKLFNRILGIKKYPQNYQMTKEDKIYLKELSGLLDILYDNKVDFDYYDPKYNEKLDYTFVQKDINSELLLGALTETNYNGLISIINNEELYDKLNNFLSRYKIIGWQDTFKNLINESDMTFNESTIAGLISNFDKIVEKIENKATLTSIIDYSNCYSGVSNFYSLLFGREDYNLIAANEGKNKASMSKYKRLEGTLNLIPEMFNRSEVTVPPINQEFTLNNGKNIGVVLGNSTNMINLTYGERTEACMRMGGAFDDLFHYCIEDKNGFHIRFVNPETGKFVSRVSGIRNGNTIFLNELRNSVDNSYNNEDLYNALKQVAEHLIKESKDSSVPIDNILVTSDYALESHKDQNQNIYLAGESRKKALRNLNFNINNEAIVLATSNPDNSLVNYDFRDDTPIYEPLRDNIRVYQNDEMLNRMIQLRIINNILNGIPADEINIEQPVEKPDYIISGEDFYISFKDKKTDIFILDKSKNNQKTLTEISNVLKNGIDYNQTTKKGSARK